LQLFTSELWGSLLVTVWVTIKTENRTKRRKGGEEEKGGEGGGE
jgi:hypothetical protein